MVILSIRQRQNREALNEDLRANRKVFERQQQQVAIMPQSEMPPNDRLQMISYQFNKDVENVKNALNDGLTDMNTPDAVTRGFADFSSVSLSWNKLVARINPYLKGQQTAADVQPATAGDYAYVRQKLKDDLLQFFQNGLQQIAAFRNQTGGRVENFDTLQDIIQQLQVGFYKNVKYGSETRGTLGIQRLPANPAQGNLPPPPPPQGGPQGGPNQPPQPQPAPAPQQGAVQLQDPQTFPQEAAFGNVNPQLLDRVLDPYQDDPQISQQDNRAREQELDGIHRRIATDINQYEGQTGNDINDPNIDPQNIIDAFPDDTRDEIQQFYGLQDDGEIDTFIAEIVDQLGIYRRQNAVQPQPQQGGPARPTPPRGRPADENRKMAIAAAADRLGLRDALTGYAGKTKAEKGQVRQQLIAVANELFGGQATPQQIKSTKRYLEQMVGFGGNMNGGFLGELLFDGVSHLAKKALDTPIGSTLGSMLRNKVQDGVLNFFNKGRGRGDRSQPLRIANNFDGNQAYRPNTLADLKNRQRLSSRGDYVGDSTGAIIPNLQNRGVLGSARRMDRTRMEGEGVAEVLAAIASGGRTAIESYLFPAVVAMLRAVASGAVAAPAAITSIAQTTRGVYQRDSVQTVVQYIYNHPDVMIPILLKFFPMWGTSALVLRLIQSYMGLKPTGREDQQAPPQGRYDGADAYGNGAGRCCFNSSMCNGTKAYRFKRGEKSANVRKESVRGGMNGSGNGVEINVKYSKLPKALQPTQEDLHPTPRNTGGVRRPRRPRLPQESYEGYQDEENDVYTHSGRFPDSSPLLHSEMLQDKALGLLKGMPRRIGVEDPKFKPKSS